MRLPAVRPCEVTSRRRRFPDGFVTLVPDCEWWVSQFYRDNPRHLVHVNIGTPPEWHGDRVHQTGLDADVIEHLAGRSRLSAGPSFSTTRLEADTRRISLRRPGRRLIVPSSRLRRALGRGVRLH